MAVTLEGPAICEMTACDRRLIHDACRAGSGRAVNDPFCYKKKERFKPPEC
ncbi:hypothetical protein BHM03_00006462 [Ensete ventricosum]|nr:hypothetical protein BHM03_00006462 [Ensete ventricosum]